MTAATAAKPANPIGSTEPYGHLSAAERYIHATRDRAFLALLRRHGFGDLARQRIVELGCGDGALLRSLRHYGANENTLAGVDISIDRARMASSTGARVGFADMAALPFRDGAFDLAIAFTSFSSICSAAARRLAASESMRVLRAGGLLAVYDFSINPFHRAVRPVSASELRDLFAPRVPKIERVTLAPPIVRALDGSGLCAHLEGIPWLRTHLLAAVVKEA